MRRRLIIVLIAAGVLLAAIVGFNTWKANFVAQLRLKNAAPPQSVTAASVEFSDWQPEVSAVGSLRAVRGVDVTTEVTGLVRALRFKSGDEVQAGQVLVELNADAEIAQQHALEAAADLSATVYERDKAQYEAQAISKAQLDADAADLKNRRAQAAAQAALVAKKTLRAPFAGRLGITTVNPGQYLNTGDKVVTLQAVDPVYVDFKLPQQQLSMISNGQAVNLTTDAFAGVKFAGRITAIDPRVDAATRNFQAEATVPNPERRLMPGMFARVAVLAGDTQRYLTLPQTAITYNPYGATVFVAQKKPGGTQKDLIAQQSFVTLGTTRGDQVAVLKGVKEGDLVVTSGQLKLINGTPLVINNAAQPVSDSDPSPQEQ
ncbi:MAG: efflux RND transporter periplasmic adaptor subunit [Steroidobacteraceae bacterium]